MTLRWFRPHATSMIWLWLRPPASIWFPLARPLPLRFQSLPDDPSVGLPAALVRLHATTLIWFPLTRRLLLPLAHPLPPTSIWFPLARPLHFQSHPGDPSVCLPLALARITWVQTRRIATARTNSAPTAATTPKVIPTATPLLVVAVAALILLPVVVRARAVSVYAKTAMMKTRTAAPPLVAALPLLPVVVGRPLEPRVAPQLPADRTEPCRGMSDHDPRSILCLTLAFSGDDTDTSMRYVL
jgi:hypothetical protein